MNKGLKAVLVLMIICGWLMAEGSKMREVDILSTDQWTSVEEVSYKESLKTEKD